MQALLDRRRQVVEDNLLIMPNLDATNITFNVLQVAAG
jgi:phosphotransacetylase